MAWRCWFLTDRQELSGAPDTLVDFHTGYKDVKAALPGVLLSTAEHEYTRYGFRRLLSDRSVDIIQPDVGAVRKSSFGAPCVIT